MMDRLSDLVSRFMHDQRGSGLTLFAAGFVLLLGMAGLVVDTGFLYAVRGELQVTADAAALAAAKKLPDETTARATAISLAGKNMPVAKHGNVLTAADVITGNWDSNTRTFTPAGTPMNALQVTTRKSQTNGNPAGLYFARLMGFDAINMAASAVATSSSAPCIVALAPTGDEALEIEMAAGTMTLGCGVQVNSNDPQAIELDGSACLSAPYINVVGGYTGSCYTPTPVTGAPAMPDPLGSLPPPAYSGCDFAATVSISTSTTLNPGTYCGGIEITGGTVTFQPGMYVVDGVGLQLTGNGNVTGSDVTFYLPDSAIGQPTGTGSATVKFAGTAQATLSAPTTGTYKGVLFYQDRTADPNLENKFTGGTDMTVTGALYFPNNEVEFDGNNNTTAGLWTSVIARQMEFEGNSFFSPGNPPGIYPGGLGSARLVK